MAKLHRISMQCIDYSNLAEENLHTMLLLAPMQTYTDFHFRNAYSRHYSGIDAAVSPFITLTNSAKGLAKKAIDVLPANNETMPVIPQILGNDAALFIEMAHVLGDWGYDKLNWNLGCPDKSIIRKKRGAGLLPYPDLLRELLEKTIPSVSQKLSVKIRLGVNNAEEIFKLVQVFNDCPLEYIIIHPRTARQMYNGVIHHDVMQECLRLFKHEIIYNGNIFSLDDFKHVRQLYPSINKWMIGRGVFYEPMLPSIIQDGKQISKEEAAVKFLSFLLALYDESAKRQHYISP